MQGTLQAGWLGGAASRGRTSRQSHPHSVATHSNVLFAYCPNPTSKLSQSFLKYTLITIFSFNCFRSITHIAYCNMLFTFLNKPVQTKMELEFEACQTYWHYGVSRKAYDLFIVMFKAPLDPNAMFFI